MADPDSRERVPRDSRERRSVSEHKCPHETASGPGLRETLPERLAKVSDGVLKISQRMSPETIESGDANEHGRIA
jgi:hypothetical protein